MTKRILLIVSAVIVVLGITVAAYFFFFSGSKPAVIVGNPTFGTAGTRDQLPTTTTGPVEGAGTIVAPHLLRITAGPVAKGSVALHIKSAVADASSTPVLADTEVRYVERQSGNVYAFRVHDRTLTRTSNKTLPGVLEASWFPDGSKVLARFVSTDSGSDAIATYALPAGGGEGYFLDQNLVTVGVTGSSTMYTLLSGGSGSVASVVSQNVAKTLFTSSLSAITLAPLGSSFLATTKASLASSGYAFSVSSKTGTLLRILGPHTGLATLPDPSGKYVFFSYTNNGKLLSGVLDVANRSTIQLPVATLAEKCTWTPDSRALYCGVPTALSNDLPDSWYQGVTSFSDRLWQIDMDTRLATLITDPSATAGVTIDMVALTTDPVEDVVVFTNKTDGSLWAYDF